MFVFTLNVLCPLLKTGIYFWSYKATVTVTDYIYSVHKLYLTMQSET